MADKGINAGSGGTSFHGRRTLVRRLSTAVFLGGALPGLWGSPLFGYDPSRGGYLFLGKALQASNLFPLLLLFLGFLFLFLWLSATLGRFWCGWLCPQSLFTDFTDPRGKGLKKAVAAAHLKALGYSALFSLALMLYAVVPSMLFRGGNPAVWLLLLALTLLFYLNAVFLGRVFCRTACPYGRIITLLADSAAPNPERDELRSGECIKCGLCAKVCPMGLDVREGLNASCIDCGRCVDACAEVMERHSGAKGLVLFPAPPGGWLSGLILKPRYLLLLAAAVVGFGAFALLSFGGPGARLQARAAEGAPTRAMTDGRQAVFLDIALAGKPGKYSLQATGPNGAQLELKPDEVEIPPGGAANKRLALIVGGEADNFGAVRLRAAYVGGGGEASTVISIGSAGKGGAGGGAK